MISCVPILNLGEMWFLHCDSLKTVRVHSLNMNFFPHPHTPLLVWNDSWKCFWLLSRERLLKRTDCSIVSSLPENNQVEAVRKQCKMPQGPSHFLLAASALFLTLCLLCLHVPFCSLPLSTPAPPSSPALELTNQLLTATGTGSGMGTCSDPGH